MSIAKQDFAAVVCPIHGRVLIGETEYQRQLMRQGEPWRCPFMCVTPMLGPCGQVAEFDDRYFERRHYGRK